MSTGPHEQVPTSRRPRAHERAAIGFSCTTTVTWLGLLIASVSCAEDPGLSPNTCGIDLALSTPTPIEAPASVEMYADISTGASVSGIHRYTWQVNDDAGESVAVAALGQNGEVARFDVVRAGLYRVTVTGQVGDTGCGTDAVDVNVGESGAPLIAYRLRFLPDPERAVPAQEYTVEIPAGVAYQLEPMALDPGVVVTGQVRDELAAPVAGYLRMTDTDPTPSGTPALVYEAFADAAGDLAMVLPSGAYHVLFVPDDDIHAPQRFPAQTTPSFDLTLAPGVPITGRVLDAAGAPVAGARVSLSVDDVPSTVGTTDAAGSFSILGRAGAPATLTVVPPDDSGLARLSLARAAGATLAETSSPMDIAYSPGAQSRTVELEVRLSDGNTPASDARITLVARNMADAGSLTLATQASYTLAGGARISRTSGPDGRALATLPEAIYDVIVTPAEPAEPGAHGITRAVLDISPGAPDPAPLVIPLTQTVVVTGQLVDSAGAPTAGAHISATPLGIIAQASTSGVSAVSQEDGSFALALAAAADHQLVIDPRDGAHPRERLLLATPESGAPPLELGILQLRDAFEIRGEVGIQGSANPAADTIVQLLCGTCQQGDENWPMAETITNAFGIFAIPAPAPP